MKQAQSQKFYYKRQNKQSLYRLKLNIGLIKINFSYFEMRRHISKQKEIPISEKVKKMFRYSPSYEAQKCYSKLPLRYSYISNTTKMNSLRQDQINCEYSSVKEKHIETNQCNDTSSWIAKLVSGIQEDDEQIRNLHKLSVIENNDISDLPEDSNDYGDNEFLTQQGIKLFGKNHQEITPKQAKFQQQVPITNPIKKSIKEALIEIELKESKEGLRGPPVTRANSFSKKQNQKASKIQSKINSNEKNTLEKESLNEETRKSPLKERSLQKNYSKKSIKSSYMGQKPKSEAKKKMKTLEKFVEKSIQVQNLNTTQNSISIRNQPKILDADESLDVQTCKNSLINFGTKKHSIHQLKNQAEDAQTRKNSFIHKDELSQCKEQFKIVEEHSKNLPMKKLFSEENQSLAKPEAQMKICQKAQSLVNKKIGGIKKNIVKNECGLNMNDLIKLAVENPQTEEKNFEQRQKELQLKYSYLSTKRQSKDITLNYRNDFDQRILIELDQSPFLSSQRNAEKISSRRKQSEKFQEFEKIKEGQRNRNHYHKNSQLQRQNTKRIAALFNKLKLDQSKDFIDKSNLKIRGLNEEERTQLGSIIAKIHYQNFTFDIDSFQKEFRRINVECTLSGCLSQQKLQKLKEESPKKGELPLNSFAKIKQDDEKPSLKNNTPYEKDEDAQMNLMNGLGHRRRNSNIIKKKLFQEIKRISYLQEVAKNQLEKNSRIAQKIDSNQNVSSNNQNKEANVKYANNFQNQNQSEEYICKDPYVQSPSLCDFQLSRRDMVTNRNLPIRGPLEDKAINKPELYSKDGKKFSEMIDGNDTCLIERLNKKLSSYIDKNHIQSTFRQFNLNFSQLKKHIR